METAQMMTKHEILYSDQQDLVHRTPWWMISIVFHAAFLLMAAMLIGTTIEPTIEDRTITIHAPEQRQIYEPQRKREIHRNDKPKIDNEVMTDTPIISPEPLPIDEPETIDEIQNEMKARGREEALSTIAMNDNGWDGSIGLAGSSALGAWGTRTGGGKRKAIGTGGGGVPTESAVMAALQWFKRHQLNDGSWSFDGYHETCKDMPPCDHLDFEKGYENWDNCATGLALICYLGAGHTHKGGHFRKQVANALAYLNNAQADDGSFSTNNYVHGITTMAVVEAYGMTRSESLREMAQKAVDVILSRQNDYLGWDYRNPSARSDTSITGWQVMALKSAKMSGLDIGNSFDQAGNFFQKITPAVVGDSDPRLAELCAYTYYTDKDDPGHRNTTCTSISLLCRILMGENTKKPLLKAHANVLIDNKPNVYENGNLYEWYYATYAMYQMGGDQWKIWNNALKDVLLENQVIGGCADGSWDPTTSYSSAHAGRVFSTAMGCLMMEVYYKIPHQSLMKI